MAALARRPAAAPWRRSRGMCAHAARGIAQPTRRLPCAVDDGGQIQICSRQPAADRWGHLPRSGGMSPTYLWLGTSAAGPGGSHGPVTSIDGPYRLGPVRYRPPPAAPCWEHLPSRRSQERAGYLQQLTKPLPPHGWLHGRRRNRTDGPYRIIHRDKACLAACRQDLPSPGSAWPAPPARRRWPPLGRTTRSSIDSPAGASAPSAPA